MNQLQQYLDRSHKHIARAVPPTVQLSPERIVKVALMAATQRGSILPQCTQVSILKSLTDLASVGLEPGTGPTAMAYLVPFRNGANWEAQPVIGYRGYVALARRSGQFQEVNAEVVHAKDYFEIELGSQQRLVHRPYTGAEDPGPLVAAYCVAKFPGGGMQLTFMTRHDVERIRDKFSKSAARGGPWRDNFDAMAMKSVIRKAAKLWPLSPEMQEAVSMDADTTTAAQVVEATPDYVGDTGSEVPPDEDAGAADAEPASDDLARAQARALQLLGDNAKR